MPSDHVSKLRQLWRRFLTLGVSNNDLHELITLAQDMECDRIASLLGTLADRVDPHSASLLRATRDMLQTREHRPSV